jgi:hypothetical protein
VPTHKPPVTGTPRARGAGTRAARAHGAGGTASGQDAGAAAAATVGSARPAVVVTERFALEERIAQGSFGEVHRGRDRTTGAPVAIKRVHAHLAGAATLARFEREAALLERVDSPHVVRCLACGVDADGRACLVLEWLDGEDLGRRRARALTIADAVDIVRQAALGLEALHRAGIVHGDVKPSNFLVSEPPGGPRAVKLIDLGVARTTEGADPAVEERILGTPSYMSPEQARGEGLSGPASDLFSLGVVLYELVAGRRPFDAREPFAALAKIALEEPPPLGAIAPGLDALVAKALAKAPGARFGSARAMADALAALPRAPRGAGRAAGAAAVDVAPHGTSRLVTAVFGAFSAERPRSGEGGWRRGDSSPPAGADGEPASAGVERFADLVAAHGGVAHRLLGGRVIAVFGAARSHPDDAARAARAALAAATLRGARLAITTASAAGGVAGLSGASIERGATALEHAHPGLVRVDEATARLIEGELEVEPSDGGAVLVGERRA